MGTIARAAARIGLGRVRQVVALSNNVRNTLTRHASLAAAPVVIGPAVSAAFLSGKPGRRASAVRSGDGVAAGFVGHHTPEKGFDLALHAVRHCLSQGKRIRLLALVSGPESQGHRVSDVAAMVKAQGVLEAVTIMHSIKDMNDFYSKLDILLVPFRGTRGPSDYPMVLLEALALGLPTVCTPVGAIPEILKHGENGFLSTDCSARSYADAVIGAMAVLDNRREEVSANAEASARAFDPTAISKETAALFKRLIE